MALILHIETATTVCSVALSEKDKLLSLKEENEGFKHAERITLFIRDVLAGAGKKVSSLDAVAVSSGPGSYTGLRIGTSTAKGLCYALEIPLLEVPTLYSLAAKASQHPAIKDYDFLCPMIDARRMEVYCALYDAQLNETEKVSAKIIDENSFAETLGEKKYVSSVMARKNVKRYCRTSPMLFLSMQFFHRLPR